MGNTWKKHGTNCWINRTKLCPVDLIFQEEIIWKLLHLTCTGNKTVWWKTANASVLNQSKCLIECDFFCFMIILWKPAGSIFFPEGVNILMCKVTKGTVDATSPWASRCAQDPKEPASQLDRLSSFPAEEECPGTPDEHGGGACQCSHWLWTTSKKRKSH